MEWIYVQVSSVAQSSMTLRPLELQRTRPPCPSPTPGVYSNSCPLSWWCHSTILSSVVLFSSQLQSFPASGSFQMSHFFVPGGQSIGVSSLASVLPMNIQDWFSLGWNSWTSLQSKGHSRVFSNITVKSINSLVLLESNSHIHDPSRWMTTWKTIALTRQTFVGKVMSLLFNMLSRLVLTFFPRSKCLLTSWLQSPSAVIFGAPKNKVCHCFLCFPIYLPWRDGTSRCHGI